MDQVCSSVESVSELNITETSGGSKAQYSRERSGVPTAMVARLDPMLWGFYCTAGTARLIGCRTLKVL